MKIWNRATTFLYLLSFAIVFHQTNGYDWRDPHGNITIRWDVLSPIPDGYVAVVNITNYQKYRKVDAPGWKLSWTWPHKEVIWAIIGARVVDQGNCNRFKKEGSMPTSCSKSPTLFDLTAEVPQSEKIDGCCKGGVLLSRLQDYNKSTTAFQIAVGGEGSKNTTWRVPTDFTFRTPRGEYSCSDARVVAPTRFISQDLRRVTQARMTWKVVCSYKPPYSQNKVPLCCVSLSSDHGRNTSCPTCSCGCQNQTHSCSTKNHDRLVSKIECTDHMCPVNINWHVMSKVKENHQRKIRVTISNLNYVRNYLDWIVLVEHPALSYSTRIIHANHRFLSSSYSKMEVIWGRKGYNQVLAPFGTNGSTINLVLDFKGRARHGNVGEWSSPRAIFFNGDRCVSPLPTQY